MEETHWKWRKICNELYLLEYLILINLSEFNRIWKLIHVMTVISRLMIARATRESN